MANIFNADDGAVSGSAGIKLSSDTSGVLNIQTNGVTAISIASNQVVSFPATVGINFNGQIQFEAGTALIPAISTVADTNTGIYFPGADQIAISTGGVQRFFVGATGDVGIGTGSPGQKLEVAGNVFINVAAGNPSLEIKTAGAGNNPTIKLTADTNYWDFVSAFSQANDDLLIRYNGSTLLNLTNTGNLGIGTSSPGAKAEIYVNRTSSTNAVSLILNDNVTGAQTNGVYKAIRSLSNNGASVSEIRFMETDGSNNNTSISFATQSTANALTERLRIDQNGNLGLGVTPDGNNLAKTFELQQGFTMFGFSNTSYLSANAYYNSGWKYKSTAAAAYYEMSGANGHQWSVANSGTAGNAITFTTALTLNANGNLVLQGGNTAANGVGVTFPATQSASSNANTLDDYEEGTWTPNVGGNATYFQQSGQYTKIGRLVVVRAWLHINAIGTGSTQFISGLPFSAADEFTISVDKSQTLSASVVWISLRTSGNTIYATYRLAADVSSTINPNWMTSSTEVQFTGSYFV